jgi:hypothetical protein
MSMRRTTALIVAIAPLVACVETQTQSHPFTGAQPVDTEVDLSGTFTFLPVGDLNLELAKPCLVVHRSPGNLGGERVECDAARLRTIPVVALTAWQATVAGQWVDARHLVFRTDWKQSSLDPLADDAAAMAAKPWTLASSSALWQPTADEARHILKLVAEAKDTEADLVSGGAAPSLEVASFELGDGKLVAGTETALVVRVANRGPGVAYRVVATTRSSVASLHGQRLSFGMIKPGTEKTRKLQVKVPTSETSPDTMLVLVVGEGNGFAPRNVSRRVPIVADDAAAVLAIQCAVAGRVGVHPDLDAGDSVVLHCAVSNTGKTAAKVELETAIAGGKPARSSAQSVVPGGQAAFDVSVAVPRELPIDSTVQIAAIARDTESARTARASVVGVVRKPKLCTAGHLTRAQYQAKLRELRAAVTAGDLTQAQLDRYDAELVTCLQ